MFIERLEQNPQLAITQAHGYTVEGSREESVRAWRTWSPNGDVLTDDEPHWDIVQAV